MESLSLNLRLLELSGIVEPPFVAGHRWRRSLFSLYMATSVLIFVPVLLGELLAFYHFWGDLVVITNNMFTIVGNLTFYGEALYIIARRAEFMRLAGQLQHMLDNMPRAGAKQIEIVGAAMRRSRTLTWSMVVAVYMVPFSWSVAPLFSMLLSGDEDVPQETPLEAEDDVEEFWKSLISIMWLPIDATKSPVKELVYAGQAFVFLITASYYTSVNTVFVSFIVQVTGQFEALLTTISDMDQAVRAQMDGTTRGVALKWLGRSEDRDPHELHPYFVDVIRHHQAIITFSRQLNDVLSPLLLFYFFSAQIMMCVMAFQMVLTWGEQNNFLKFFFGLLCVLIGPFFFCWQGNIFIEKSLNVQKAVYNCEWYERSQGFKKLVLMVITRTQRPVQFTAGKLYLASLESFAKMLNSVYYYFAVLKQLHEE
ncbi:odorant receptor 10-like [Periplaneta americana]|uniref:odorant receptor 10-like n=1 Tax=Periplaneta americana TaxID=6978 RepID=UPI0037E8B19E